MSYRPICDNWILARPKVKYYGAYPNGFLERARALLGVGWWDPVLHVCSGAIRDYPGKRGVGPNDVTVDLGVHGADLTCDVRDGIPAPSALPPDHPVREMGCRVVWPALLADPPYTLEDADHYEVGRDVFPLPGPLVANMLKVVEPGGKVGILHYQFPRPPKDTILVAKISVSMGWGNTDRVFTVLERPVGS